MELSLTIGELKRDFSKVMEKVRVGESVTILYGRSKQKIGKIVPYPFSMKKKKRPLGLLEGKASVRFGKDFSLTNEEFLNL